MNPIIIRQIEQMADEAMPAISVLSNSIAALYWSEEHISWAGIYYIDENLDAWLGLFQGKPACMKIPAKKGVIGACVQANRPILVKDVHSFEGHVACDATSKSEIVLPLYKDGKLKAVLDLDSDKEAFFTEEDQNSLTSVCRVLEKSAFCVTL